MSRQLSIVIPVGPGDRSWLQLLKRICKIAPKKLGCEVLISACREDQEFEKDWNATLKITKPVEVRLFRGAVGRGKQLNKAISKAKGEFIWVLHADSKVCPEHIELIWDAIHSGRDGLYYFLLGFSEPRHVCLRMNAIGANLRSYLGMPFGDQGFFFKRRIWKKLGGFSESVAYGEDHLFVWQCHQTNVPLFAFKSVLYTSSRRYSEHGWLKTTLKFAYLTWAQAIPESLKLLRVKISKRNQNL